MRALYGESIHAEVKRDGSLLFDEGTARTKELLIKYAPFARRTMKSAHGPDFPCAAGLKKKADSRGATFAPGFPCPNVPASES